MLKRPSGDVQDAYQRAGDARQRAEQERDERTRAFWHRQEDRWIKIAAHLQFSERLDEFVERARPDQPHSPPQSDEPLLAETQSEEPLPVPPEARLGIFALLDVFRSVCLALDLTDGSEVRTSAVANAILGAALDGEDDLERLYQIGLRAVAN